MAHFAQLDENNTVLQVIVVADEDTKDGDYESEAVGIAFCKSLCGSDTNWKQTSYNSKIRANYAGIGYTYSEDLDAFIPPKPYDSWVLTASANWVSPLGEEPSRTVDQIANNQSYVWDESAYQADNTTGWVLETPE